ncbi:outer membrane beta-barrel protein [Enterovibrio norvegicus]|uniref:Outer membrane beta-barrel protein n=1 Tax=Enterovibrio norvegicus TaxID=188144 RepID=A0ABV4L6Y6_9GAMM|nr:outer membrane beta-barrel protein [Enterovibrio norvegicus]OEF56086.1 hypothetical protein A1OU_15040 [Enterovibrio norvegicus]
MIKTLAAVSVLVVPFCISAAEIDNQYIGAGAMYVHNEVFPTVTLGVEYSNGLAFELTGGYLETEYHKSDWDRYDNQNTILQANLKQTFFSNEFSEVYVRGSVGGLWWDTTHYERTQTTDPYEIDGSGSDSSFLWGVGAGVDFNLTQQLALNLDAGILGLEGKLEELDYSKTDATISANVYFKL